MWLCSFAAEQSGQGKKHLTEDSKKGNISQQILGQECAKQEQMGSEKKASEAGAELGARRMWLRVGSN